MSSRNTTSGTSKSNQSNSQRRQRSRSTSRYADLEKPKKKKALSATTSLVSIPNTIKLSMLNSGLLSFERVKLEARDENNSLSQTIPDKPIELRHFVKLCEQRRKFPVLYKLEFQTAVKVETNSCRHACRKNNEEKNQNQKCIPYDYNRVVLEKIGKIPDSDYINASYVDSLLKPNAYIVTQGPTEETVNDFWRMIWQEKVSAIIMLTKTFDFTKVMCMQYWPPALDKLELYGDIHLGIVKEEQLANFQIRTFRIWKLKEDNTIQEERQIIQFHYTEWHSHTCPFSNPVLEFRRRVRSVVGNIITANSVVGPMLVHCNDGGGRSGVYLAVDANLELAEEEDCFHVFGYLKKLRQSRKGLIDNVDQYKFVYDTLEEHIVCGKTWFSVSELSERLKAKAAKDPSTKMNKYQEEYAQICKQTPRFTIGDCAGGHRADNRDKNRDVLCVPPDNFRPYLTSYQGNAYTDYINSVFVDGYTKPREYIVTEWPLKHTLGEFWSLVYDQECSAVVVLLNPPLNSLDYPSFWPTKSKMEKYGPVFSVHSVSRKHYTNIKQWEFRINKKIVSLTELMAGVKAPTKTVQLFQLTCFPLGHKVPTSTNSLVALMNMVEQWRARTDYGPVCVVSPDGRSRAGVYCAANACIEQVIQHGEVDVFQAVKTVRRHRPQLVENMMEYKYCYDLVLHYVLHYLNKDLNEKKFIEFGRGKVIPLTPDSSTDLPNELSNTGKIVVKKRITKIERSDTTLQLTDRDEAKIINGKIVQRKKKGRLYSLGGNEPVKKPRGRLDRLRTVGTFDLGAEMSVLSEVARNLNEKIICGDIDTDGGSSSNSGNPRRLSVTPVGGSGNIKSGSRTPERRPVGSKQNINKLGNTKNILLNKCDLSGNQIVNTAAGVKNQHSADDVKPQRPAHQRPKPRSVSSSSYLISSDHDTELKTFNISQVNAKSRLRLQTTTITESHDIIAKDESNDNDEIITDDRDSNKIEMEQKEKHLVDENISEKIEKDSNKIEMDEKMTEVNTKNDDDVDLEKKPRKPVLRKSKRIVRTDSEIFAENIISRNEIVLKNNLDIQIHKEPENYEYIDQHPRSATSSTTNGSRKESSDIDDICSPRDMLKSTDDSSRNQSTDELDTVFSDTTDLERLQREYRDLARSNLQREYKSDGDTLDEIGKKRNDYLKWKNQSFENDFELYNDNGTPLPSDSVGQQMSEFSRVCSPQSHITITSNSSGTSSTRHLDDNKYASSRTSDRSRETKKSSPLRESDTSTLNSPVKTELNYKDQPETTDSSTSGSRPSKLDVSQPVPKENSITNLFEKRFGKFKKMNKLLKCKRFSTSALYDRKKSGGNSIEDKKTPNTVADDLNSSSNSKGKTESSHRFFGSRFSPSKSSSGESKQLIYSSKLSLFNPKVGKGFLFSSKKAAIYSNNSRSNNELNVIPSTNRTKLSELSKSNSEISKFKSSPARVTNKKSIKENKNNSTACLYKDPRHSPLSEEFYNKTGSVRLSAMELYEKFCSEDFGGLYKHETVKNEERMEGSCGGYRTWHEYRLGHKGLGAVKKFAQNKHARLLRQKSEPKFSFKGETNKKSDLYFPEEEDEDIYEEDGYDHDEYYDEEYGDEYEDEEGDYYEDEEGELEDEEGECEDENIEDEDDEEIEELNEEHLDDTMEEEKIEIENIESIIEEQFEPDIQSDYIEEEEEDVNAYHSEIEYTPNQLQEVTATDSEVDEIFLMPSGKKCSEAYEKCGFENKKFSLEQNILRKSASMEQYLNYPGRHQGITKMHYSPEQEIKEFGSDEILTIYKICSKDDMLNMSDVTVHQVDVHGGTPEEKSDNKLNSLEYAVNEYVRNAPPDEEIIVEIHSSPYSTTDGINIENSDSMEMFSSSSGTMHSGSTLTEYAFDTVRNLKLDSCSTSKLSLSLKSEIFDDFTLTPDEPPKIMQSCVFEDFTLTPDGSFSEGTESNIQTITQSKDCASMSNDTRSLEMAFGDQCTKDTDVVLVVDKFLANERLDQSPNTSKEVDGSVEIGDSKEFPKVKEICNEERLTENYFAFEKLNSLSNETDEKFGIIDLDEDPLNNSVSDFTTELTKEFDLLFSRAEQSNEMESNESTHAIDQQPLSDSSGTLETPPKMSTRYSMQRLEPYIISDSPLSDRNHQSRNRSISNNDYCKILDMSNESTLVRKRIPSKFKSNRSQSLGNLSNKTRCFPL